MKPLQLPFVLKRLLIALLTGTVSGVALSQSLPAGSLWFYTLVNGSQLVDDCPICDRATIAVPMRGTFQLRFVEQGPLFFTYALENISFTATGNGRSYKVTGSRVVDPHLAESEPKPGDADMALVTWSTLDPLLANSLRLIIEAIKTDPQAAPEPSAEQKL